MVEIGGLFGKGERDRERKRKVDQRWGCIGGVFFYKFYSFLNFIKLRIYP